MTKTKTTTPSPRDGNHPTIHGIPSQNKRYRITPSPSPARFRPSRARALSRSLPEDARESADDDAVTHATDHRTHAHERRERALPRVRSRAHHRSSVVVERRRTASNGARVDLKCNFKSSRGTTDTRRDSRRVTTQKTNQPTGLSREGKPYLGFTRGVASLYES